jgi:ribose transport system permease protein/erythritol transport system permease protein
VTTQTTETQAPPRRLPALARSLVLDRVALLTLLLVVLLVWMFSLSAGGYLVAPYDLNYMASALESMVPLAILGLAQLLVIVSGRGGIDLSVGAMVSLVGMLFGFAYGMWGWPLLPALALALAAGVVLGAINGLLVAYLRVPALIATLATYYAFSSLALISNDNAPISTRALQDFNSITTSVNLGVPVPLQVFTFLLPVAVIVWLLVNRTPYGRKLYGIGTNEVAARYASLDVQRVRFTAYLLSGLLSAVVAVVTVAQFASARPDAGTVGNGMALPAITIAVLGGVAIAGGVGRVGGVLVAALLIVWLNAGILLYFAGSQGSQYQLFALGAVLLASALFNSLVLRRRGAT